MRLCWRTKEGSDIGNAFGYATHNKLMKKYSKKYFDYDDEADIALSITPADHFVPVRGKFNVLFTMWEFLDLPRSYIEGINKADAVIVPSRFCKDLFQKYTNNPVDVCWEGVEKDKFPFQERRMKNPFRFLWIGAANPRKGYPLVLEAIKVFEQTPDIEIYLKTTVQEINWWETLVNCWRKKHLIFRKDSNEKRSLLRQLKRIPRPGLANKVKRYGKNNNVIVDTRKLPLQELIDLYQSANCFLLPTFGEGWGLTLCEAMATGCPSIATNVTGIKDYFSEKVGYPLNYEIKEQEMKNYDLYARGYIPDTKHLIERMMEVIKNYPEALRRGRRASKRIKSRFTWEQSAKRLNEIIGGYNVN